MRSAHPNKSRLIVAIIPIDSNSLLVTDLSIWIQFEVAAGQNRLCPIETVTGKDLFSNSGVWICCRSKNQVDLTRSIWLVQPRAPYMNFSGFRTVCWLDQILIFCDATWWIAFNEIYFSFKSSSSNWPIWKFDSFGGSAAARRWWSSSSNSLIANSR